MIRLKIKIKKNIGTILLISPLLLQTQPVAMSSKKLDHVITLPECQKSKFANWPQKRKFAG